MANIRQPQYGVEKDELTLTTQDPASVLYGINPNNKFIPIKVTTDGSLAIGATIEFEASDLQIGAVEIKNATTEDRVVVSVDGELRTESRLHDAAGTGLTSTLVSGKQALDVNLVNSLALTIDEATSDILVYGWDGAANQKIKTNVSGELQVGIVGTPTVNQGTSPWIIDGTVAATQSGAWSVAVNNFPATQNVSVTNATLAVTQSGVWSTGRTWTLASGTDSISAVQSGTWNINNISGTISLPTGASTEATLSSFRTDFNAVDFATETTLDAIKTQTDLLTFTGSSLNVNITGGATLEVNLDNANDDVLVYGFDGLVNRVIRTTTSGELQVEVINASLPVTQSGTWNLNNITGTISLPTGAATEATLLSVETNTDNLDVALSTRLADATFTSRINTLGQKTMANSTPVVLSSDQSAIPITDNGGSLTVDGTVAATQSGAWSVSVSNFPATQTVAISQTGTDNNVDANITNASIPVTQSGTWSTRTQDGSGNAITSTGGALDVNVTNTSGTGTVTTVARSNASQTLLAANSSRKGATIYNDAAANLFVKLGATASTSSFTVRLQNTDYYEVPFGYTDVIDGVWASNGAGDAKITELT